MNQSSEERRAQEHPRIVAVSRDKTWLDFARKTLRRTDDVETLTDLSEATGHVSDPKEQTILLISSELIPAKIGDYEKQMEGGHAWKTCVLREAHDEHHRINDKHLKSLGAVVEDRPDNQKAMRRLIKILLSD